MTALVLEMMRFLSYHGQSAHHIVRSVCYLTFSWQAASLGRMVPGPGAGQSPVSPQPPLGPADTIQAKPDPADSGCQWGTPLGPADTSLLWVESPEPSAEPPDPVSVEGGGDRLLPFCSGSLMLSEGAAQCRESALPAPILWGMEGQPLFSPADTGTACWEGRG